MRDIGIVVWVVLLLVGVIGSMISSVRRQMQQAPSPARRPPPQRSLPQAPPQQWTPPQAPPAPPAHRPARPPVQKQAAPERPGVRRVAAEEPHDALHDYPLSATRVSHASKATRRLFSSREGLVGAVIAAEVLGKPVALREYPTY